MYKLKKELLDIKNYWREGPDEKAEIIVKSILIFAGLVLLVWFTITVFSAVSALTIIK